MKRTDYLIAPIFGVVVLLLFVGAATELLTYIFSKESKTQSDTTTVTNSEIATISNPL